MHFILAVPLAVQDMTSLWCFHNFIEGGFKYALSSKHIGFYGWDFLLSFARLGVILAIADFLGVFLVITGLLTDISCHGLVFSYAKMVCCIFC